jgi:hypothetical protein
MKERGVFEEKEGRHGEGRKEGTTKEKRITQ